MKKRIEITSTNIHIFLNDVVAAAQDGYSIDEDNIYVQWGVLHTIGMMKDEETELDKLFDGGKNASVYVDLVNVPPVKKSPGRPPMKAKQ